VSPTSDQLLDAIEGVNWRAAFAGAIAAAALSFILLILGVGLGLSSVSPWAYQGAEAATIASSAIAWVIVTQLAASGIGGYMAGRLRGRWSRLRDHEVYFRDTAHGLLAWGLATLLMIGLMGVTAGGVFNQVSRTAGAAASLVQSAATATSVDGHNSVLGGDSQAYWVDTLLRTDISAAPPTTLPVVDPATDATTRAQAAHILLRSLQNGTLAPDDSRYLAQIVSVRTGLPVADAQRRVTDIYERAHKGLEDAELAVRQKADEARKASAYTALWLFVALLAGAFISAWMATFGGRQRDEAVVTG